jgi:hypothetical protein
VLVSRGKGHERILDLKEVREPALSSCTTEPQPDYHGSDARRSLEAQKQLQSRPPTGLELVELDGRPLRLRLLVPEENRTGLDELRDHPRRLRRAVGIAGRLTAWAHVRGSSILGENRAVQLKEWANGAGLDAVIASAVRYADQTRIDHRAFCRAGLGK